MLGLVDSAHIREAMNQIAKRGGKRPRPSARQVSGYYRGESGGFVVQLYSERYGRGRCQSWHVSTRNAKGEEVIDRVLAFSSPNAIRLMHRVLDKAIARES